MSIFHSSGTSWVLRKDAAALCPAKPNQSGHSGELGAHGRYMVCDLRQEVVKYILYATFPAGELRPRDGVGRHNLDVFP